MLLTPDQVRGRLEKPASAATLQQGRALERRHRLHIEGDKALLWQFLQECRPHDLVSEADYLELQKIIKAATKPVYSSLTNIISKVFTAAGTTRYFDFARPELQDDWDAYLKEYSKPGLFRSLEKKWFAASLTGFQGLLLVDLPSEPGDGLPEPYFRYVPSKDIYDLEATEDELEYVILQGPLVEGKTDYWCFDERNCHRFRHQDGRYDYLAQESTVHDLGFVPATFITTRKPELEKPILRTSYLSESLEIADVYLVDFNNLQWGKRFHSFQKFWSYGVRCEHIQPAKDETCAPVACTSGYLHYETGKVKCPRCKGLGRYVPVGADKTYIVEVPNAGDPTITPPGGYIQPELDSPKFIAEELVTNEARIEKAVLGKEGILSMQTKQDTLGGKMLDLGPVYDRLATVSEDLEQAEKFVLDTMARYRYGSDYRDAQITRGRRYQVKSADQLEQEYAEAKKSGLDESILYAYLEDIIYTKWAGDPMELERNLLKLQLTPFPTCTVAEARIDGVATVTDLALKRYLNDFVARFEDENGSILEFASALAPAEKVRRIREQFISYLTDKSNEQANFTFLPVLSQRQADLTPAG